MNTEEQVIEFARQAHKGQTRKFGVDKGKPYFGTHVVSVALKVYNKGGGQHQVLAGYLHAVKEDTDAWDENKLARMGVGQRTFDIVDSLTKRYGENYLNFILRVMENPDAIIVKLADIEDNLMSLDKGSLRDKYLLAKHLLELQLKMIGR